MKKRFFILFALSIMSYMAFCQSKGENLKIDWPDEYKWKVGSDQENDKEHLIELVPGGESIDNWKTMGTMHSYKGVLSVPVASVPDMMLKQAKKTAPDAKLSIFEKDEKAKNPWIIFKIESPGFTVDPRPESQLFYVVQGQTALYVNFAAVKEKELSDDFVKKWIKVFKASEMVYQQ
jgi:hypothetical protein